MEKQQYLICLINETTGRAQTISVATNSVETLAAAFDRIARSLVDSGIR